MRPTGPQPITVLESANPPDGTTRYIDQVVTFADPSVTFRYLSLKNLLRKSDVFHVHWPEVLVRGRTRIESRIRCWGLRAVLALMNARGTAIVRTLHNLDPHEAGTSAERNVLRTLDYQTDVFVTLNSVTDAPHGEPFLIPHGHYRDRFAPHVVKQAPVPGRILYAGLIRPYKGVEQLVGRFRDVSSEALTLRIVGKPTDTLRSMIEEAEKYDPRVSHRFGFIPDDEFVAEIAASELVCLPYAELHNSGMLLVALSLNKPVLVPSTATTRALAAEVGPMWVHLFEGPLATSDIERAIAGARLMPSADAPRLEDRDWHMVAQRYDEAFREGIRRKRSDARKAGTPVYAWITGQVTNVGDSLLRRPYVAMLARIGSLDLWVRRSTPEFLAGLSLPAGTRTRRGFGRWYVSLLSSALRTRTVLALNAGQAPTGRGTGVIALLLAFASRVVRMRGGTSLWVGASVRPDRNAFTRFAYRRLAAATTIVSWREPGSAVTAGERAIIADWAFAEGSSHTSWAGARDTITIVMRGDRPKPEAPWLTWIRQLAERNDLRICIVVQVRGDEELARWLADKLDADVLEWPADLDHPQQEAIVRSEYRRSRLTVGDRLHGLILAITEGSIPLGWVPTSNGKIGAHFEPTGLTWVARYEGREVDSEEPIDIPAMAAEAANAVSEMREQLEDLSSQIVQRVQAGV